MAGEASGVLPLQKVLGGGGGQQSCSCAEGTISFEVVLTWELEVLAIVMWGGGGAKSFHPLKGGPREVLPCLAGGGGGGGEGKFQTCDVPIL